MPSRDQFTTEIYVNGEQARDALSKLTKDLEKLRNQYANLNKSSKNYETRERELAAQIKATEQAIATAEKGTDSYRRAMENLNKRGLDQLIKMQRQLNSEIKKLDPNDAEFKRLSKNYQEVTQRIKDLRAAQEGVSAGGGGIFKRAGSWLSNYYGALVIGYQTIKRVAQGFMDAYKTISNFEQANANLASILGATSDQMEILEKAAIQLGSSTRYSASQVTGLQTELAKLGFTVKEITDMSPAVLNFAGSVGTDLASAASLAGVALRSFDLRADQTEDALGTMAVACNKSALSFQYLQNAFSTIAPVAKTYGLSLKDTIALLGTLANAGFDASSAATATRNILLNLSDTNGKLAKALGGSVHLFEDIMAAMKKLREQGVDLNETLALTDKRSVAAFNTFLDGAESAQTLRGELEDVNGELQRMAEQRANTVEGAIDGMKSAWEGLVLSFRSSTGTFASVFKFITGGINGIRDLIDPKGSIEERTAKMYSEMFRNIGNEFISVEETRERVWAKYQELEKSIREGGGGVVYKKHALEGLKSAYNEVMPELTEMAKSANEKVLELNTKYMQEEQKILKQQAKLTENGLNQSNTEAYNKLQEQLEANRKAWNQAIDDATKFKKKMDDIVEDTGGGTGGKSGGGGGVDEKELAKQEAARKKAFSERKAQLEALYNYETKTMKAQMLQGEMTEAEYNAAIKEKKAKLYEDLLALAEKYKQDDSSIRAAMLDDLINDMEKANKAAQKELDGLLKQQKEWEEENLKEWQEWQKKLEEMTKEANAIKATIDPSGARDDAMKAELDRLKELHDAKLLSDEEYAKASAAIEKKYANEALQEKLGNIKDYAEKAKGVFEGISNFVIALKDYESAKLEAQYQADLTAAGDNAEKREEIEANYQKQQLDLQKKYADADMAIKIAKTTAAGAVAAIRAYEEGGPYAGIALAAMIALTTAAEIATIVEQRNAIKNTSPYSSSSAGTSSTNTGGLETGTRHITGYAEGGYTEGHATLTTVGERGIEWVAPAWMVRSNPTTFANLEQYRKAGSHGRSGSFAQGFAEGGFAGGSPTLVASNIPALTSADIEAAVEAALVKAMDEGKIYAIVQYGDILIAAEKLKNFKKQTTR